jgi:ASC-1-like (ASCH) protein
MDHVAIMQPSWGLLPKIIAGTKTVESRWYVQRRAPWGRINPGDKVYFKNAGAPVTVRAFVSGVRQFDNLTPAKVQELLGTYGQQDGLAAGELPLFYERFKAKRYCILVSLDRVEQIAPFQIDKSGYGLQSAWLSVPDIRRIVRKTSSAAV